MKLICTGTHLCKSETCPHNVPHDEMGDICYDDCWVCDENNNENKHHCIVDIKDLRLSLIHI